MTRDGEGSIKHDQFVIRFPSGLRDRVKTAAERSKRSMNGEIVARLESTFGTLDLGPSTDYEEMEKFTEELWDLLRRYNKTLRPKHE